MKNPLLIFLVAILITGVVIGGLFAISYNRQSSDGEFEGLLRSQLSRVERGNSMTKYEILNAEELGAVCNDGTPAVFYYRPGSDENVDKWVIHLKGGGGCLREDACLERWENQNHLMSSKSYRNSKTSSGILSPDEDLNPDFYNFNHVHVPYCSSDFWTGNGIFKTEEMDFEFRGAAIVNALLDDLQNDNRLSGSSLSDATQVLLTGSSAGGFGLTHNLDRAAEKLSWAEVKGVNDSGWSMLHELDISLEETDYDAEDISVDPEDAGERYDEINPQLDQSCVEANANEPWRCMTPAFAASYIETPYFLFADQVDGLVMRTAGLSNAKDPEIKELRDEYAVLVQESAENIEGAFLPRAGQHTAVASGKFFTMKIDGYSYREILTNWFFGLDGPIKLITE
ncbi:MAG: pectin acetylesterase-family hydrolase [Patescibacteria group bacterium]